MTPAPYSSSLCSQPLTRRGPTWAAHSSAFSWTGGTGQHPFNGPSCYSQCSSGSAFAAIHPEDWGHTEGRGAENLVQTWLIQRVCLQLPLCFQHLSTPLRFREKVAPLVVPLAFLLGMGGAAMVQPLTRWPEPPSLVLGGHYPRCWLIKKHHLIISYL